MADDVVKKELWYNVPERRMQLVILALGIGVVVLLYILSSREKIDLGKVLLWGAIAGGAYYLFVKGKGVIVGKMSTTEMVKRVREILNDDYFVEINIYSNEHGKPNVRFNQLTKDRFLFFFQGEGLICLFDRGERDLVEMDELTKTKYLRDKELAEWRQLLAKSKDVEEEVKKSIGTMFTDFAIRND